MIIEAIFGFGWVGIIGYGMYKNFRDRDDSFYDKLEDQNNHYDQPKLEPSYSTHVELVLELLKTDAKYKLETMNPSSYHTVMQYTFDVGVKLTEILHTMGTGRTFTMHLLDENGVYYGIETTSAEETALRAALKAYQTRAKRAREDELTRLLATRVLNPGTVRPVLESPAVRAVDESDSIHWRTDDDTVSTSYVTFDKERQQVVRVGPEGAKQVMTSSDFEERYGLRGAPGVAGYDRRAIMARQLRARQMAEMYV